MNACAGVAQLAERKPSKLDVAGSTPVSRSSIKGISADVAQLVEHILGKDEVTSSNLVIGSSIFRRFPNGTDRASERPCRESKLH